jgi:hypothetical protein
MPSFSIQCRLALVLAGGLPLVFAAGCTDKKVHAAAPVAAAPQPVPTEIERPMNVAPDTTALPPEQATSTPPPVPSTASSNPPVVTLPKSKAAPAPPKPASGQPGTEANNDEPARPVAPQITPQLSQTDQDAYKRLTDEDTGVAEQNLHLTDGKQLSPAQKDIVEKISSFLAESRDAVKAGDWVRAKNLAEKARSLSVELVSTL